MSTNPNTFLRRLKTIHLVLLASPLLLGVFYFLNTAIDTNGGANDVFVYVFPMFGLAGYFASKVISRKLILPLKDKKSLSEKLIGFQTASIIQYTLVEGPALLNILWFGMTGNLLFLTIGGALALYLFSIRPKKEKIIEDLALSMEEKRALDR
ncbi:Hypothetical protein I595_790 [Croceitalea dokdonensis DOKDO 023]|uniref:Uncharacterized protein n=1 Tax=Croceitalea dokdonensis DOKDO 023 TaxID=1300341 RepID=A0A0P7AUZ8_9FLAO|nr:hypothetical protein [Croceitalea dokdonensis]KPM32374.1 Hypothetical protein I595_790 [Croceitalea dokdonensis DOKDO 023]